MSFDKYLVGPFFYKSCQRCPQTFKVWANKKQQTMCADCRYVLRAEARDRELAYGDA